MKIAFFDMHDWQKEFIQDKLEGQTIKFFENPLTLDNIDTIRDFNIISVFIHTSLTTEILDKLTELKFIATRSTGFNQIDIDECNKRDIIISNVPSYGEKTIAEHTFALILNLSRNVHKSHIRTQNHDFSIEGLKGFDLYKKTIGVIGAGHIGLHVIRIAKGFGMKILVTSRSKNRFLAEVLGFEYVPLNDLLAKADIITLHIPYNKHTHHIINKENINLIKRGALLINTARGGLVDKDALIEALDKNILRGVGLDVLEGEELLFNEKRLFLSSKNNEEMIDLVKDQILLTKQNVIFTPHIAFYSQEALERILEITVDNINSFMQNSPINVVS
ncbi:MAG: NAD(P)-dependent oxidoreductase [Candidatus Hodarchaeales archaeon]|jgi:D-lactate dehydrogenase